MSRKTISLEIDPAHETLLRQYAAFRHKNARAMAALICCRQTKQWDLFWSRAA